MLPGYTSGTNNSWKTNVKFYYEGLVILDLIGTIFSLLDAKDYFIDWLIDWYLMPTLAIFQLYHGMNKFNLKILISISYN
jgi:hypothetical protein